MTPFLAFYWIVNTDFKGSFSMNAWIRDTLEVPYPKSVSTTAVEFACQTSQSCGRSPDIVFELMLFVVYENTTLNHGEYCTIRSVDLGCTLVFDEMLAVGYSWGCDIDCETRSKFAMVSRGFRFGLSFRRQIGLGSLWLSWIEKWINVRE